MSDDENAVLVLASSRLKPVPRHRANIEITPVGACGLYVHTVAGGLIIRTDEYWRGIECFRGTGFSREGGMSDDENAVLVLASSRLKPVPRQRANIEITPAGYMFIPLQAG
ncbi:hypothetical protein [Pseudomonas sp. Irchel 3A5]|uniref:hypothetical protein n=1 Tax=Pseudomonas sp. Irchel 3A5 TaxID=2008911 RepID=UPI000BA3C37A|nr:hypothetical protein [Pseudomonas sp. Irchel 3A5]